MAIAVTLAIAITMGIVNSSYNNILKDLPEKLERYESIDEVAAIVNSDFYGELDSDSIDAALVAGYIKGLNDPYSVYMTADEYETYLAETQGKMSGIGIEYSKNSSGKISVDAVYSGSPAYTAGLRTGDLIVAFDGEAVMKSNYDNMVAKLIGDKLTTVNLTYRRSGAETTVSVVKGYEAKSVTASESGRIGYIKISNFFSTTAKQVEQAVEKYTGSKYDGIILDVRGNSSTNFDEAMKTLDIFVPLAEGGVATLVNSAGEVIKTYTSTAGEANTSIAVLIDGQTGGAAETLACELRDFGKAELVGSTTKGMGLAQQVFQLTDGGAVRLTIGQIVPYVSESFHGVGLEPDYEIENQKTPDSLDNDVVYVYASSILAPDEGNEG